MKWKQPMLITILIIFTDILYLAFGILQKFLKFDGMMEKVHILSVVMHSKYWKNYPTLLFKQS